MFLTPGQTYEIALNAGVQLQGFAAPGDQSLPAFGSLASAHSINQRAQ
jgi:hypothetical protein